MTAARTNDVHFRATAEELARYSIAVEQVRPKVSGLSELIRRLLDAESDRLGIPETPVDAGAQSDMDHERGR